jgi:hypothetical protein
MFKHSQGWLGILIIDHPVAMAMLFPLSFQFYSDFISNYILTLTTEAVPLATVYLVANQVYNFLIFPILFQLYFKLHSYPSNRGYATRDNILSSQSGIFSKGK